MYGDSIQMIARKTSLPIRVQIQLRNNSFLFMYDLCTKKCQLSVSDTRVIEYVPREGVSSMVVAVAVVGGVVILLCACSGLFYILWKLRALCKFKEYNFYHTCC